MRVSSLILVASGLATCVGLSRAADEPERISDPTPGAFVQSTPTNSNSAAVAAWTATKRTSQNSSRRANRTSNSPRPAASGRAAAACTPRTC